MRLALKMGSSHGATIGPIIQKNQLPPRFVLGMGNNEGECLTNFGLNLFKGFAFSAPMPSSASAAAGATTPGAMQEAGAAKQEDTPPAVESFAKAEHKRFSLHTSLCLISAARRKGR